METRTVLFVDDEPNTLNALRRVLLNEPYKTLFADSAKEALEVLRANQVHVILSDMRMPRMSGIELLKIVKREYPYIIRLLFSAYTDIHTLLAGINQGEILRFVAKPWGLDEELRTIIRQAIEYYDLHSEHEIVMNFIEQWIEGVEPEKLDIQLIKTLIAMRKKQLYEWRKKCGPVGSNSE
ncbi:MAG TPA: response regulator [Planctomycetes bacterium]|nr:response regulator [Planctomycetota bacterium]HIJ71822.1 response regulator [Planctomycetota bacterium]